MVYYKFEIVPLKSKIAFSGMHSPHEGLLALSNQIVFLTISFKSDCVISFLTNLIVTKLT